MALKYHSDSFKYFSEIEVNKLTVSEKFYSCFHSWYNLIDYPNYDENTFESVDFKPLILLLEKHNLIEYFDLLKLYHKDWLFYTKYNKSTNEINKSRALELDYFINLAEMMMIFYSGNIDNITVTASQNRSKNTSINSPSINLKVKEIIEKEYKENFLNEVGLTYAEAKKEILSDKMDYDWFVELRFDGIIFECFDGINFYPNKLSDDVIFWYAKDHYTKHDNIDLDLLKKSLDIFKFERNTLKLKSGKEPNNMYLGDLCINLSYLHRFESFMNQNVITDIKKYTLFSETNVFIYDYLSFWDLIPKDIESDYADYDVEKANYIKTKIQAARKARKDISDYAEEIKINTIKGIKNGLKNFNPNQGILVDHNIDFIRNKEKS